MARHILLDDSSVLKEIDSIGATIWGTNSNIGNFIPDHSIFKNAEDVSVQEKIHIAWEKISREVFIFHTNFSELYDQNSYEYIKRSIFLAQCLKLLYCVVQKSIVLENWISKHPAEELLVTGVGHVSKPIGINFTLSRFDPVFAELASLRADVPVFYSLSVPEVSHSLQRTFVEKFFDFGNMSISEVLYKFYKRNLIIRKIIARHKNNNIIIINDNDIISDSFISLLNKNFNFIFFNEKFAESEITAKANTFEKLDSDVIGQECFDWLQRVLSQTLLGASYVAAEKFMEERTSGYFSEFDRISSCVGQKVSKFLMDHNISNSQSIVMSNGLYSPYNRLLAHCFRNNGVKVCCFDHGIGNSLSLDFEKRAKIFSDFCNHYYTNNVGLRDIFAAASETKNKFEVSGTSYRTRNSRLKHIIRKTYRKNLGVQNSQRLLMYVPRLLVNNMPNGHGSSCDGYYQEFQHTLLKSFCAFDGVVCIKGYPAKRYRDPDPTERLANSLGYSYINKNSFEQYRWASDVLVLDLCSSTLGYALGSRKPIIFVENTAAKLTELGREEIKKSLFYIDSTQSDWTRRIESFLKLDHKNLEEMWREMEPERKKLDLTHGVNFDVDCAAAVCNSSFIQAVGG